VSAPHEPSCGWQRDFAPLERDLPFLPDPVIEAYKRYLDRTLLRENLRRTPAERFRNLQAWQRLVLEMQRANPALRRV
jgi:hypothetical protein